MPASALSTRKWTIWKVLVLSWFILPDVFGHES